MPRGRSGGLPITQDLDDNSLKGSGWRDNTPTVTSSSGVSITAVPVSNSALCMRVHSDANLPFSLPL